MTGSGKTGLCIGLLEEAAIDGIPALIIDPKGDLANLMLTLSAAPWRGLSRPGSMKTMPARRDSRRRTMRRSKPRCGRKAWGIGARAASGFRSSAMRPMWSSIRLAATQAFPVSILKSFAAPSQEILDDTEMLRERISTTVTSLLGLVGVEADPIKSREHILLSTILDHTWRAGQDLDLATLIQQIQTPPVCQDWCVGSGFVLSLRRNALPSPCS